MHHTLKIFEVLVQKLGGPPKPLMVNIMDNGAYVRALLHSYHVTIIQVGVRVLQKGHCKPMLRYELKQNHAQSPLPYIRIEKDDA